MSVGELIEELRKVSPLAPVYVYDGAGFDAVIDNVKWEGNHVGIYCPNLYPDGEASQ